MPRHREAVIPTAPRETAPVRRAENFLARQEVEAVMGEGAARELMRWLRQQGAVVVHAKLLIGVVDMNIRRGDMLREEGIREIEHAGGVDCPRPCDGVC